MESSQVGISSHKVKKSKKSNISAKNKQRNQAVSAIHGNIYQLKLLMLVLYRGVSHGYSFRLGTEIEEAEKFDDLMFECTQNGEKVYRLLQAKHKLDEESKKITAYNLLIENNGDYNLTKYCKSYLSSKRKDLFKDGLIKDVIICTNIDFDHENLKRENIRVEKVEEEDDILDVVGGKKQPQRYRISQDPQTLDKINEFSVDEVKDFLDHLVFAVNQPNEQELEIIIKEELGKEFDFDYKTKEDVYNKLFVTMLNWFKGKDSDRFFSSEEGINFFEEAKRGMPIWFGVRDPVESFVGRDKQLYNLHRMLQSGNAMVISQSVSISGLGGIGKSELVRKYINEHSQDYDNKVVWINAENYQTLSESFRRLACDQLGKSTKNANGEEKNIKSIVEDVYKFFSKSRSLFVFDNAEIYRSQDEFDQGIDKFLVSQPPNKENRPHIIITSRNQKWPKRIKVLTLEVFTEEEAVKFIKNSLNIENNEQEKEIFELSKELQYFPLALQQAVSYIRVKNDEMKNVNSRFQISDYLEKFKEKAKELLNFEFPDDSDNEYTKTTYITWNVTLDAIKQKESGEDALEILNVISYLGPENITVELLLNRDSDKKTLGSAIELLKQHSMVNSESGMLNIHRLVQHVTRIKLEYQNKEEATLRNVLELFKKGNLSSKIVDHAIVAWNHSSKYTKLIENFLPVSSYISSGLGNSGRYEESLSFGFKIRELLKTLSSESPKVQDIFLVTENNITVALSKLGQYDIALEQFHNICHNQNIIFKSNDSQILEVRSNIALTLAEQGKYDEALKYFQEILKKREIILKENHPDTLSTKRNIAKIFMRKGKFQKALQMFQELFDIQEATLEKNDPESLETKNNIGAALLELDKVNEALQIFQDVLEIQGASLEKNHPNILNTKNQIALALVKQGKYNDALQVYQEILTIESKIFRKNHPNVLRTRYNLAGILHFQSKYDEALKAFKEIFEQQKNSIGDDHPDTLTTQCSLASTLSLQGKDTEAVEIYDEVLKKREVLLGKDHIDTLAVKNYISRIFIEQGKYDKAFQNCKDILAVQQKTLGNDHYETLITKNCLGMALYYKNKNDKALQILQETLNLLQTKFPCLPETFHVKSNIAFVLLDQGKDSEALQMFRDVLASQEAVLEKEHHSKTETKYHIAKTLLKQKKYYEALKVFQEVFEGFTKVFGSENKRTLEAENEIHSLLMLPEVLLTIVNNNDFNILKNNLKRNRNINNKDSNGFTILHHAVNTGMVQFLLKNGADVSQITKTGNTTLHIATSKGFNEIVKILLQHASQSKLNKFINAKTTSAGTSLHIAAKKGFSEIFIFLLKHGAIYNIKNKKGKTPFSNNHNINNLLKLTAELFKDAEDGNDCVIKKLKELEPEKIHAVMKTRNNLGHTLVQVAGVNKNIIIASKLLEILKTLE